MGEMDVWVRRPEADVPRQEDRRSQTWRPTFLGREVDVSSSGGCGALMFLLMGIDGGKGIAIPRGSVGDGFEEGAVGFCGAEAYEDVAVDHGGVGVGFHVYKPGIGTVETENVFGDNASRYGHELQTVFV